MIGHDEMMGIIATEAAEAAAGSPPRTGSDSGPITFYELRFYMFSNFSSFMVNYDGRDWMTAEHCYQAMKFESYLMQECIRNQRSAHLAMKVAQANVGLYRIGWDDKKADVMLKICRAKLAQHEYIQRKLMQTGDRQLIESSPIDSFWGWGPNKDGQNHLGRVWMTLRDEWRQNNEVCESAPKPTS
jgi:ribA/ribD-fused uncharacterized protein